MIFEIPDELLDSAEWPREKIEGQIWVEVALVLYTSGAVSAGKAAEVARIPRMEFEDVLGERQIVRNYSAEDLQEDLAWSRKSGVD